MASERLQAITWNGTQTSLTASSCKTGLTSHFYGANKASELPLVPMSGTGPPPSTIGASARRHVRRGSKGEGGKRADHSTRNARDGGAARGAPPPTPKQRNTSHENPRNALHCHRLEQDSRDDASGRNRSGAVAHPRYRRPARAHGRVHARLPRR